MLFGIIGVSIPIIIHILNRRRARMVDWGAMHFLESSLASRNRRILIEEIILMAIRCSLLALLAFALARPFLKAGKLLPGTGGDAQDLAIVIDASLSMTLESDGSSNFQRAIDEAHQLVRSCRSGDAVSIVLAGPVAQPILPAPISDRDKIHESLDKLTPAGGSMRVLEAINTAMETLSAGTNPAKRIVLITDAQDVGWDLSASKRWDFLAEAVDAMPIKPIVIVRTLDMPKKWHNVSATGVNFSRAVVGTDRTVKITATIANTGEGSVHPEAVELTINGKTAERKTLGVIAEGASASAVFDYQFTSPGPHVVSVRIACDDDLHGDNETARVVNVLQTLKVLIVTGNSSLRRHTDYIFLATALPDENAKPGSTLISPTVISASDISSAKRFSDYAVVVLADVPRLPAPKAKELSDFVARGGGLLIAPGEKANRDFYNNWKAPDGKRLAGCRFVNIRAGSQTDENDETFTRIAPGKINHPAMMLLADQYENDLRSAHINRHWVIDADEKEKIVSVGALLDNGLPWLVQRKLARGVVLTLAAPLDREFTHLPLRKCFVPLVHELVHYLAAPAQPGMNILPGRQFVYTIQAESLSGSSPQAEVADPAGRRTAVRLRKQDQHWKANYSLTARPGVYRLILSDSNDNDAKGIPFVVLGDPDESKLDMLSDDDYKRAGKFIPLTRAQNLGELTAAIAGGVPGSEIWRHVAVIILALLIAEIVTTRLIAQKRKMHLAEPITFGAEITGRTDMVR
jgi:hypothetical protein